MSILYRKTTYFHELILCPANFLKVFFCCKSYLVEILVSPVHALHGPEEFIMTGLWNTIEEDLDRAWKPGRRSIKTSGTGKCWSGLRGKRI